MKTLSKAQVKKIQEILLTKKGKVEYKYIGTLQYFFNCEKVRVWDLGNKSRSARVIEYIEELVKVIEICGYDVIEDNDAPRGGRGGDYYIKTGNKEDKSSKYSFAGILIIPIIPLFY